MHNLRKVINMLWQYLKKAEKPILLYGMGDGAEKILNHLLSLGITPSGVFASDGFARHNIFRGYEVISYSEAQKAYGDFIALICFGSQRPEVLSLFKSMLSQCELYAPDVPVYGTAVFDEAFCAKNRARLERIYSLLADSQSKKVFENTVKYKLTGDIRLLFDCETDPEESFEGVIKPNADEVFLDLGAYTGDTVRQFADISGGYEKIIAVEPDRRSFKKLKSNTSGLHNIELYNVAVSSGRALLPFSDDGGRQSVLNRGDRLISCESIDSLLDGGKVTYIKMDVEGQEAQAIRGAENTIRKYRPKMCISAYHRSEDYFLIPELVYGIRSDYKIYMRHFPYVPAWDTSFYFI